MNYVNASLAGTGDAMTNTATTPRLTGNAVDPIGVRIEHVRKEFAQFPALHDVSLEIRPGELIALLGPSGSGKTTLLRLIAGLDFPTEGAVYFGDEDASHTPVKDRKVGFVFQHYALFKHMTVLENVTFGLRVRPRAERPPKAEIRRRALELLDFVQLSGLDGRYPNQLSGGQRQRVALARALAIEPRVLLLDEPFGALDAQVRKGLRRWLRDVHEHTGHTTVFVTHDQEEALELADRVVVLSEGRIEQVGGPDEVYDHPNSPNVFSFIGESSKLPVTVETNQLLFADRPLGLDAQGMRDGAATLFFRPHDVEIVEPGHQAIVGVVVASRRTEGTRQVELEVGGGLHRVEIELPVDHPAATRSRIAFRPRRWKVFPARVGDATSEPKYQRAAFKS